MQVRSLGQEYPLEEGTTTHSSILAWRIPWTEKPGGYGLQGRKESNMTEATYHIHRSSPNTVSLFYSSSLGILSFCLFTCLTYPVNSLLPFLLLMVFSESYSVSIPKFPGLVSHLLWNAYTSIYLYVKSLLSSLLDSKTQN